MYPVVQVFMWYIIIMTFYFNLKRYQLLTAEDYLLLHQLPDSKLIGLPFLKFETK